MTAAFGVLTNRSDKDVTVVSATNSISGRTELHEMTMVNGAMNMRPVDGGIPIPAGGSATLDPGGLHLMILDVTEEIGPGDDVSVTLTFDDDTTLSFTAQAKEFAGANEEYEGEGDQASHDVDMEGRGGVGEMDTTGDTPVDGTDSAGSSETAGRDDG